MRLRLLLCLLLVHPLTLAEGKPDVGAIYGRIQFVTSFPDYKVQVVESFADLHVQMVESFPDKPGRWQIWPSPDLPAMQRWMPPPSPPPNPQACPKPRQA